jgi:ATP-dependent Clp protease ATP-binding subunit ClpC
MGFRTKSVDDLTTDQIYRLMEPKVKEALKRAFRPEFLNRLDEVILFRALNEADIIEIADKFLERVGESAREHELELVYTDGLKRYLAERGFSKAQGARPLRRVVQKEIEDPLSERILKGDFGPGDTVKVDVRGEGDAREVTFEKA